MKFGHFKIRNAYAFKSVDLKLEKQGLVRLVGRNGAGKSSLWNLFTFLYYGLTPLKQSKSDITLDDKDFLLESSFEKNGIRYWVALASKSKEKSPTGEKYNTGYYLFRREADGTWKDISQHKAKDTQKFVVDLLGWSIDEWYGYVYLAQRTSHKLINGTNSERQRYLSSLFNLDPLDTISEHYSQKAVESQEKIRQIDLKKNELEVVQRMLEGYGPKDEIIGRLGDLESALEQKNLSLETSRAYQLKFDELQNLLTQAQGIERFPETIDTLEKTLERLRAEEQAIRDIRSKQQYNEQQIQTVRAKLVVLPRTELPEDYERIMASPDISVEQENLRLREAKTAKLYLNRFLTPPTAVVVPENAEEILQYPDIDLNRTKADIQKIEARPLPPAMNRPNDEILDELRMDFSNANSKIQFLHDRRAQLMMEGVCPTCATELDPGKQAEHRAKVDAELEETELEKKQISSMLADLTLAQKAWNQYDLLGPDRTEELPALKLSVEQYELKQRVRTLIEELKSFEEYQVNLVRAEQISAIEVAIQTYQKKLQYRELKDKIQEAENLLGQLRQFQEQGEEITKQLEGLSDPTKEISETNNRIKIKRDLMGLEEKIGVLQAEGYKDVSQTVEVLEQEVSKIQMQAGQENANLEKVMELTDQVNSLIEEISSQQDVYRRQVKYSVLAKAYGKAGKIRQGLLAKFSKYLEDALACHTFRQLPNHRFRIQVDDGISIQASKNGSEYYDVATCSGGEQGVLSGALLFALDDMLPQDRRSGLKVIDEAESAFDQERKVDFIEHMLPEMKKRAETVIVISHTEIDDQTVFDRTWEVRDGKVNDVSGEIREFVTA